MPFYRATLLFEHQAAPVCGFSESWEFQAANAAAATATLNAFQGIRPLVLSQSWKVIGNRLAEVTAVPGTGGTCKRKYSLIQVGTCPVPTPGQLGVADIPNAALLVRLSVPEVGRQPKQFQMRGIPDSWWANNALDLGPDLAAVNAFFNAVTTGPLSFGHILLPTKRNPGACAATFTPYLAFCIRRISSRRTGKTFFPLRGRKSKKKPTP